MNFYIESFKHVLANDDFITSDKFLTFANINNIPYYKRDLLYSGGEWRGKNVESIIKNFKNNVGQTLFIGHSDKAVGYFDLKLLKTMGIRYIYGTNILNKKNFSTSLPLGITNNTNESKLHKIFGDTLHFLKAHESTNILSEFNGKIYANFSKNTNLGKRENLLQVIKQMDYIVHGEMDFSNQGRIKYLTDLRTSSFVLCPEGNGIDTHRIWETIYMGGIPIIIKNNYLSFILNELPVLQINDWSEILNIKYLEFQWNYLKKMLPDFSKIQMNYWYNLLRRNLNIKK